jgi:DNA-binding transcriptional ArsR family regulator
MRTQPRDEMRLAHILKAMGHPTRLRILQRIAEAEFCVSDLERELEQSQPNISQHLAKLRDCGLIIPQRRGGMTCYRLTDERMADVIQQIRDILGLTRTRRPFDVRIAATRRTGEANQ